MHDMAALNAKDIQYLRDNQCEDAGKEVQRERGTDTAKWVIAQAIVVIIAVVGMVISIISKGI